MAADPDAPAFPGGGYTDCDGLWHTDHRTVRERRSDAIWSLLAWFVAPWLVLGVVLAVASWLT